MDEKARQSKLDEIIESDTLGLLNVPEIPKQYRREEDWRLIDQFQEISQFYEDNQRLPNSDGSDIREFMLASRLSAIKSDPKKVKVLLSYDMYNLLQSEETKTISLEDLIKEDPLDLLASEEEGNSIFNLSHVKPSDRLRPDYIARRKVCKDFDMYEDAFKRIQKDLSSGRRKLLVFNGQEDLIEGRYFVLRGVTFYLETDKTELTEKTYQGEVYRRRDGRTRCIFDNGTESTMLFRSLVNAMRIDGFGISDLQMIDDGTPKIEPNDVQNGYIYVLRSLSHSQEVRGIRNLYKIGYCTGDITSRIKNAENNPTYLMSGVEVILSVRCFNLDVSYLEANIHRFFEQCNIFFEIIDDQGKMHYPREWFVVPLPALEEAISLIVKKEIEHYRYNPDLGMIIKI
ncbi:GIY-YIG nuclease family protein [Aminivibrio sp.]|uniref:GIY-YIG nuclease family protein n=1 Tax=Aminivibrio sp. TaxID=1872489 RepID=UPI001A51D22E|nr:GIY-YIG nuclease family protein [Aminivibrio sp.]MBL3539234.1 GIY-YIG nuclease family protein [Aminivibrio sp.]